MGRIKNCLVWLRNDLRFHDNEVEKWNNVYITILSLHCKNELAMIIFACELHVLTAMCHDTIKNNLPEN